MQNLFLTGSAGTGKSFTLKSIVNYLENKGMYDLKINNNKKFIDNNLEQYKKEIIEYIKINE